MTGNATYRLSNTALVHAAAIEPPEVMTSAMLDELLAPAYERLRMPKGLVQTVAGVRERRWWPKGADYVQGAVDAGRLALTTAGVDPEEVGLVINASVTRPHLEPAIACRVHHELGLPASATAFDVTNACLAMINAIQIAGTMIDAGQIEYALVVASEGIRTVQENTIERLLRDDSTRADVKEAFASLTLGCGAAAFLLGRADANAGSHRVVGGVSRAGSSHHLLCIGSMDGMWTDHHRLFIEGIALATETWKDAKSEFEWDDLDWYVAHQTSMAHIDKLCRSLALPIEKFPMTLPTYGNIGPVALPFTLAQHAPSFEAGQRVLLMGIGSGLNTAFAEVEW